MRKPTRTTYTYLLLSLFAWIFNFVYSLFSHGVTSGFMANMYLVLLIGAVFYFLLHQIPGVRRRRLYRVFFNTLNTSVAVLVVGMALRGIIDIAGSSSQYLDWYFDIAAVGFILSMFLFFLMYIIRPKSEGSSERPEA